MQNSIQKIISIQNKFADWPAKLELSKDIKLFNEVLEALDAKPELVDAA